MDRLTHGGMPAWHRHHQVDPLRIAMPSRTNRPAPDGAQATDRSLHKRVQHVRQVDDPTSLTEASTGGDGVTSEGTPTARAFEWAPPSYAIRSALGSYAEKDNKSPPNPPQVAGHHSGLRLPAKPVPGTGVHCDGPGLQWEASAEMHRPVQAAIARPSARPVAPTDPAPARAAITIPSSSAMVQAMRKAMAPVSWSNASPQLERAEKMAELFRRATGLHRAGMDDGTLLIEPLCHAIAHLSRDSSHPTWATDGCTGLRMQFCAYFATLALGARESRAVAAKLIQQLHADPSSPEHHMGFYVRELTRGMIQALDTADARTLTRRLAPVLGALASSPVNRVCTVVEGAIDALSYRPDTAAVLVDAMRGFPARTMLEAMSLITTVLVATEAEQAVSIPHVLTGTHLRLTPAERFTMAFVYAKAKMQQSLSHGQRARSELSRLLPAGPHRSICCAAIDVLIDVQAMTRVDCLNPQQQAELLKLVDQGDFVQPAGASAAPRAHRRDHKARKGGQAATLAPVASAAPNPWDEFRR